MKKIVLRHASIEARWLLILENSTTANSELQEVCTTDKRAASKQSDKVCTMDKLAASK